MRRVVKQVLFYDDGAQDTLFVRDSDNVSSRARMPHDTECVNVDNKQFDYIPNTNTPTAKGIIRRNVISGQKSLPEVYRILPLHSVPLTEPLQWIWFLLNPEIDGDKWRTLLGDALAWCNNGSGIDTNRKKADYVNQRDLSSPLPAFDQVRGCGGHTFRVKETGNIALIETIRVDRPLPAITSFVTQLLHDPAYRHLWYYGTSISPTGRIYYIQRKGKDGQLKKVRIPLYSSQECYLPSSELHWLNSGQQIEPNIVVHK